MYPRRCEDLCLLRRTDDSFVFTRPCYIHGVVNGELVHEGQEILEFMLVQLRNINTPLYY